MSTTGLQGGKNGHLLIDHQVIAGVLGWEIIQPCNEVTFYKDVEMSEPGICFESVSLAVEPITVLPVFTVLSKESAIEI
jgi:hypothetical protein